MKGLMLLTYLHILRNCSKLVPFRLGKDLIQKDLTAKVQLHRVRLNKLIEPFVKHFTS